MKQNKVKNIMVKNKETSKDSTPFLDRSLLQVGRQRRESQVRRVCGYLRAKSIQHISLAVSSAVIQFHSWLSLGIRTMEMNGHYQWLPAVSGDKSLTPSNPRTGSRRRQRDMETGKGGSPSNDSTFVSRPPDKIPVFRY